MGCGFKIILALLAGRQRCWTPRSSPGCPGCSAPHRRGRGGLPPRRDQQKAEIEKLCEGKNLE